MKRLAVDEIYGYDSVLEGDWVWCVSCNRVYKKGMYRRFSECWRELNLSYFKGKDYRNEKEFEDFLYHFF